MEINEIVKIVWPYTFNSTGTVNMEISTTTGTAVSSETGVTADISNGYLHRLTAKLNAD